MIGIIVTFGAVYGMERFFGYQHRQQAEERQRRMYIQLFCMFAIVFLVFALAVIAAAVYIYTTRGEPTTVLSLFYASVARVNIWKHEEPTSDYGTFAYVAIYFSTPVAVVALIILIWICLVDRRRAEPYLRMNNILFHFGNNEHNCCSTITHGLSAVAVFIFAVIVFYFYRNYNN